MALSFDGNGSLFWEFLFFLSFAFVLVKSVQMAGILQVFSFLIMPALIGRLYTRKPLVVLLIGWGVGLLASVIGIGVSFKFDLPTAPMTVASLSLIFMVLLLAKSIRYYMGGHDHMHNRAIITSPDSKSAVQDITTSSNSYKFYIPQVPSNDEKYNIPANGITNGPRETPISQELFTVGYYIVTVDGPRVTVDFYSSPNGCNGDCDLVNTPTLTFTKRETFGYSLNGQEFLVAEGESYSKIEDSFGGTTARFLSGSNGSTTTYYSSRALTKAVNTGWTSMSNADDMDCSSHHRWPWFSRNRNMKCHKAKDHEIPASDILTLWGMSDLGTDQTDTYALSMSYDHHRLLPAQLGRGLLGLATRDQNGNWVNAVDMNFGGNKEFVLGHWKPGYDLGTYGIDLKTHTAWAVINYSGDFAIAGFRHCQGI